jgi:hypothetical protein
MESVHKRLLIVALLCAINAIAVAQLGNPAWLASLKSSGGGGGGGPTYLLSESFEGTGYENSGWSETGTPNEDDASSPLQGSQSYSWTSGNNHSTKTFSGYSTLYIYFQVNLSTLSDYKYLIQIQNSSFNDTCTITTGGSGHLLCYHGTVQSEGTFTMSASTTYHVWVDWIKGTGANGTMQLFIASSGTRPGSPDINITTGNGAVTERIIIGPDAAGIVGKLDRLLIDDVTIGSNP